MDIDRCNSIFELFAAFNFTYAILSETVDDDLEIESQHSNYVDVIDKKLLRTYPGFIKRGKNLKGNVTLHYESIKTDLETPENSTNAKLLLMGKFESLCENCEVWLKNVHNSKKREREKINSVVPYLSFFLATFCIAVLGLSISEAPMKHFSLALLVVLSLITYIIIFSVKGKLSFINIASLTTLIIVIVGLFHLIIRLTVDKEGRAQPEFVNFFDDKGNEPYKIIVIIVSLMIPFSHFVYYFFKMSNSNKSIVNGWKNVIQGNENTFNQLKTEFDQIYTTPPTPPTANPS